MRIKHSQDPDNKRNFKFVVIRFKLNPIIFSEMISDKIIPKRYHNTKSGLKLRIDLYETMLGSYFWAGMSI